MPTTARIFLILGSISGALAVILGAFGAHALRERLGAELMEVYHTANQYHFFHTLGLLAVGLIAYHLPDSGLTRLAGWLMVAGLIIFSGTLYALSLTGTKWLGAITPIGGLAFIVAWVVLAAAVWRG